MNPDQVMKMIDYFTKTIPRLDFKLTISFPLIWLAPSASQSLSIKSLSQRLPEKKSEITKLSNAITIHPNKRPGELLEQYILMLRHQVENLVEKLRPKWREQVSHYLWVIPMTNDLMFTLNTYHMIYDASVWIWNTGIF